MTLGWDQARAKAEAVTGVGNLQDAASSEDTTNNCIILRYSLYFCAKARRDPIVTTADLKSSVLASDLFS